MPKRRKAAPMSEEDYALLRIRTLRRDGYRCRWRNREHSSECGQPSALVGFTPLSEEFVALCYRHATR